MKGLRLCVRTCFIIAITSGVGLILYSTTGNRPRKIKLQKFDTKGLNEQKKVAEKSLYNRKGKVVILYTNQRSGSTFVGEFFNQNPDAFYLFEPLFSYTPSCKFLYEERLKTFRNQCVCDFREVANDYKKAHDVNHYGDQAGRCLTENICFVNNHVDLLRNHDALCSAVNNGVLKDLGPSHVRDIIKNPIHSGPMDQRCGVPLNMTYVSALCSAAPLVAYKLIRICDLEKLQIVYKNITDEGNDVYVVHLLRDPRAIVNSALNTELKMERVEHKATVLCGRIRSNLQYVKEKKRILVDESLDEFLSEKRYMRIRHEDISFDPIEGARQIYRFLGLDLPTKVKDWILESSIDPQQKIKEYTRALNSAETSFEEREILRKKIKALTAAHQSAYGTVRDSRSVIGKWRKSLPMSVVEIVQRHCGDVMEELGYQSVTDEKHLRDETVELWRN